MRILLLLLVAVVMSGCESYYWKKAGYGGFTERQRPTGEWIVEMTVPDHKSERYAEDLCILRCAELAYNEGGIGFVVVSDDVRSQQPYPFKSESRNVRRVPDRKNPLLGNTRYEDDDDLYPNPAFESLNDTPPRPRKARIATKVIRIVSEGEEIPAGGHVYDAQFTIEKLQKRYRVRVPGPNTQPTDWLSILTGDFEERK